MVWLRRLVFEYGSSPPISLDLCADDEDPSQLIIRPGWDAPHVRCCPRTFCAWPCLLRQVGTVLGSPYDYALTGLAYANPGSRHMRCRDPSRISTPASAGPTVGANCRAKVMADVQRVKLNMGPLLQGDFVERVHMDTRIGGLPRF